ncbi:hypothetical protein AVEN_215814-1 [Araneus ventricosus]|uniref:PiggyBac transposable element-derived protein domain-containing protein n=1 Tax=Araneus ventricosus TaxID=182803 RepID=A0A4Y2QS31_ARAVE|nr:hypothetical protein AVEN_215814-1 [Araneus ventricosus]
MLLSFSPSRLKMAFAFLTLVFSAIVSYGFALHVVLARSFETDEDPDFENEDNRPGDVLEEIFSDHESFCEHDTESEEGGDPGNEDAINSEWFSSKDGPQRRKAKFMQNIRCHNIVSRLPGTKGPAKDVTSPVKSWELFINDNTMQLIAV